MRGYDIQPLHYVATDLATNYMRDTIDAMDEKMFNTYLNIISLYANVLISLA
jgi:hypothetical protein